MVPIQYNLRSLWVRKVTTIATALGVALVVFVLGAALMLSEGIRHAMNTSGKVENVILLRNGSDNELSSAIDDEALNLVRERPEVARLDGGASAVVGEIVIIITAERSDGSGGVANLMVRGSSTDGLRFRPEIKIISGRAPQPGTNEVIVGRGIAGGFKGVALGQSFELRRNRPLKVVGTFSSGGSSYESEVLGDVDVIRTSLGRTSMVSSARIRLTNPQQFDTFRASVENDKRLGMKVMRETVYYDKQSSQTSAFLKWTGVIMAVLLSIAAMIFAAITMNGAVANRTREIGTLRALGFSRLAILSSFVLEAIALALIGGAAGTVLEQVLVLFPFRTMNFQTFSEIVIHFKATPGIIAWSLIVSIIMGLIGGMVPAIRAARVSPVEAMRGG